MVSHAGSDGGATLPLTNLNVTVAKSKRVPLDGDNNDVLSLPADDSSDVFYALAIKGDTANVLAVDVI